MTTMMSLQAIVVDESLKQLTALLLHVFRVIRMIVAIQVTAIRMNRFALLDAIRLPVDDDSLRLICLMW